MPGKYKMNRRWAYCSFDKNVNKPSHAAKTPYGQLLGHTVTSTVAEATSMPKPWDKQGSPGLSLPCCKHLSPTKNSNTFKNKYSVLELLFGWR